MKILLLVCMRYMLNNTWVESTVLSIVTYSYECTNKVHVNVLPGMYFISFKFCKMCNVFFVFVSTCAQLPGKHV